MSAGDATENSAFACSPSWIVIPMCPKMRQRWRESQQTWFILLQFMLRPKAGSSYRYTDQPQHHSCEIWYFDPRCLLQGCVSLIQYSAHRLNLVRAVSCVRPRWGFGCLTCLCTCFHQFVMFDITILEFAITPGWLLPPRGLDCTSSLDLKGSVMPPVGRSSAGLCTHI